MSLVRAHKFTISIPVRFLLPACSGRPQSPKVECRFISAAATPRCQHATSPSSSILDYGDIVNALFGGGPAAISGKVPFKVVWNGVIDRVQIRNTDPVYGGFGGSFIYNTAQMEWTASVGRIRAWTASFQLRLFDPIGNLQGNWMGPGRQPVMTPSST
jgi:hypothetical protein